jgi:HPt (histidine-containing phosphotransfer) domain-containing protein
VADDSADSSLIAIRKIFLAALPARLQKIQEGLASHDLATAKYVVHQLRGTGSGFGLPELSGAAGRAEDALIEYDARPSETVWQRIEAAVAELHSVCRSAGCPQGNGIDST